MSVDADYESFFLSKIIINIYLLKLKSNSSQTMLHKVRFIYFLNINIYIYFSLKGYMVHWAVYKDQYVVY